MENIFVMPNGQTVEEIIVELEKKLQRIKDIQEDRDLRISKGETDIDDCWRSIKSNQNSQSIIEANLKLAKQSNFKTTEIVETISYSHPDYNDEGILREGQYGQYVMFQNNDEKPLFVNPNCKTKRGLKGMIIKKETKKVETLGEYVFDGRGGTLTSMGSMSFVTCLSEDDYLLENTEYIFENEDYMEQEKLFSY